MANLMEGYLPMTQQLQRVYPHCVVHDQEIIPPGVDLGAVRTELGTHSNRKGCATYLLALSTSLSVVCVYLRAGWTLGRVQDRYILGGPGGDQLTGRAASGLPINKQEFSMLPQHFTGAGMERRRKIGIETSV